MVIGLLLPMWLAHAQDILVPLLKANGEFYTNVTVTKVTATDIFFTSSNGMGNAKLKYLDRKLQKQFRYNAKSAKAEEIKQVANAKAYHEKLLHDFPAPAVNATNQPPTNDGKQIWAKSFLNQRAPDLYVDQWLSPVPETRGKFLLYDFWSTTVPASLAEVQELNEFQREFSDKLVIIGVSDEAEETVRRVSDPIIQYAVGTDPQARTKNAIGVTAVPHLMLIDPQGIVRWEGYPFLPGHEFSNQVLVNLIAQFDKASP